MTSFDRHPSVTALRSQARQPRPGTLPTEELRRLCLEAGADDVGFVPIDRPDIASERAGVLQVFPAAKVLISVVCRMNREPVRSPARSIANLEFHHSGDRASACVTHNYREFLHGFTDWVEHVADSHDAKDYRRRVTDQESVSMWQSLSFGANYKAAYCLAVCPAGEDVLAPFVDDRPAFLTGIVKPLQQKQETIYVVPGSDADEYVTRVFPHKTKQHVNSLRPTTITGFLDTMHVVFQAGQAKGIDAVYHLIFTGKEPAEATVTIRQQTLHVQRGLIGKPDCTIKADSQTWLGFLRKERSISWALLTGRIRVRGGLSRLQAFGRCFPG